MSTVIKTRLLGLLLAAITLGSSPMFAQHENLKVAFDHVLPNVSGKKMVAVVVSYPPGAKSLPHHHAASAFIYAYVLSGEIRSQVGDEPPKIYHVGEGFYENMGSFHRVSENASDSAPASMLAIFIVDSNEKDLTTPVTK